MPWIHDLPVGEGGGGEEETREGAVGSWVAGPVSLWPVPVLAGAGLWVGREGHWQGYGEQRAVASGRGAPGRVGSLWLGSKEQQNGQG